MIDGRSRLPDPLSILRRIVSLSGGRWLQGYVRCNQWVSLEGAPGGVCLTADIDALRGLSS